LQFLKEVKAIAFSLVPTCGHIGDIRVKPIAPLATKSWFSIGNPSLEPMTNRALRHAKTTCNLFVGEPLVAQFEQLLIAVRSLCMAS